MAMAPWLLALSIAARLAWTYLVPNGANFVDLHVYVGGAATLDTRRPSTTTSTPTRRPTSRCRSPIRRSRPWCSTRCTCCRSAWSAFVWQIGIIAALYGVVRLSQRLLGSAPTPALAMLWTAVGIWTEPLRSTFDYGQVNVLLVLAVLCAVYSNRWWLSGLLVGLAAGVKLTPAVAGLYFVGARRWGAALFSAVVFLGTVGVSLLVVGDQARYYFTDLLGDADRVGPIGTSFNQSWRGGISRILGHDAGYGPVVLVGVAVTAVLAVLAWRAIGGADDRLGAIVDRAAVRPAALADLVDAPLGVADPADDLAAARPAAGRSSGARVLGWGWLALTAGRGAVAAELRAADHLGDPPALVPGLGRPGLHRRHAGDAGVDRGYWPTIPLMSRAISTSFSVMPPSECVTSAKVTVRQRMSMSGW